MLLLPYQRAWVADESRVQVAEKSRRIGITWASAIRAVHEATGAQPIDTYYTGYKFDLAEAFIREAGDYAQAVQVEIASQGQFIFDDVDGEGNTHAILASRIVFGNGQRIVALSSSPRNLRGIQGRVIIDEFAFHDNPDELLKAAMATLIWGGRVSIISTHNGEDNAFNRLIQDVKAGRFAYSLHRTTFDEAIEQGLYQRVRQVGGTTQTEQEWRDEVVAFYGDGADEELHCIPRRSGGVYIPALLIEAAMCSDYFVRRLKLDDDYALKTDAEQEAGLQPWLDTVVARELAKIDPSKPTFIGEDFGRRSDMTAIACVQHDQALNLHAPCMFELRNVPFHAQKTVLLYIAGKVPKLGRVTLDSSGNGMYLGEVMAQHYGDAMVDRIGISVRVGHGDNEETRSLMWPKWYAENLPKLKARFEDGTIVIPKDYDVRNDLTAFQIVNGIPSLPKLRVESKVPDGGAHSLRHGDTAIALALAEYASRMGEIDITAIERPTKSVSTRARRHRAGVW